MQWDRSKRDLISPHFISQNQNRSDLFPPPSAFASQILLPSICSHTPPPPATTTTSTRTCALPLPLLADHLQPLPPATTTPSSARKRDMESNQAMTFNEPSMEHSISFVKALQVYNWNEDVWLRVSCLHQQLLTCQTYTDREALRQQQLLAIVPWHHKHYSLPKSLSVTSSTICFRYPSCKYSLLASSFTNQIYIEKEFKLYEELANMLFDDPGFRDKLNKFNLSQMGQSSRDEDEGDDEDED
ncbi:hypothetical protein L1987_63799 [Smallanthus sonchifolius]|uniref:Uncharacterized protein n=1 Tax=Smallanthus sonchifolius TaxID=185202 RepID=A0ACB9CE76_9ASTR|nr:hypothetical protein L1987_63799 [Smallanthus sonchifolius]